MEYLVTILVIGISAGGIYFLYRHQQSKDNKSIIENTFLWFIFTVAFPLTPILFNGLLISLTGAIPSIATLINRGELLLVSTAITADATGRLIFGKGKTTSSKEGDHLLKIFSASGCLLVLFLASLLFAAIISAKIGAFDVDRIAQISIFIFVASLITSMSGVVLSELA